MTFPCRTRMLRREVGLRLADQLYRARPPAGGLSTLRTEDRHRAFVRPRRHAAAGNHEVDPNRLRLSAGEFRNYLLRGFEDCRSPSRASGSAEYVADGR